MRRSSSCPSATSGRGGSLDPLWLILALAFPAVFINLGHGHNGFLTAALIGAALVRSIAARRSPAYCSASSPTSRSSGISSRGARRERPVARLRRGRGDRRRPGGDHDAAFGTSVWDAFLASTQFTRIVVLETGETGWQKIQSVFSVVRMWGGPVALAYAVQGAVTLMLPARWRGCGARRSTSRSRPRR